MIHYEREVKEPELISAMLDEMDHVHIGMFDEDGYPYVVPLNFGYEIKDNKLYIYTHFSKRGHKLELLRKNSKVCAQFSIFNDFPDRPYKKHRHDYRSVIAKGKMNIIDYKINGLKRFDIVIVDEGSELLIKRVIGLPGESVQYKDNKLFINGKKVIDNYGKGDTDDFSIVLDDDEYFVLGDNRENSMDSRAFGAFSKNKILGKTSLTIFPFNRLGNKE